MGFEIGDLVLGTVNQIRPYALFLTFEDGSKGLLHISEISDNYVRDIELFGSVGDVIKVKVIEIDPYNGFLRVSFKQVPEEERYSTHDNSQKRVPQFDEADFSSLEAKLPEWIEETLKKARNKND
ncbi:MAG: S1 RNA-binding domain-containing protein [Bacilli bacterium]|nr:S1 RNA-binding domain-containing protein [Bacilli bacterium]